MKMYSIEFFSIKVLREILKMSWNSHGNLREFSFPKMWLPVIVIIILSIWSLQFLIQTLLHSFLTDNYRVLNIDVAVLAHVVKS